MGDYKWVKKVDEDGVIRDALEYQERLMTGFFFSGTVDLKVLIGEDERIVNTYDDDNGKRIAVIEGPHGKYRKEMKVDSTTPGLFG